jgi:hypothetical protein
MNIFYRHYKKRGGTIWQWLGELNKQGRRELLNNFIKNCKARGDHKLTKFHERLLKISEGLYD